jgi:hypothetical protein
MCGNTWEVKVEKQKASVISSVSATNNLKLKILYDNEALNGFSRLEALKEMRLIVPYHCTVRKREIFNLYPKTCKKCSAGCTILI